MAWTHSYLMCFGQLGTGLIDSHLFTGFAGSVAYSTRLHLVCTARPSLPLIIPSELSVRLNVAIDMQRVAWHNSGGQTTVSGLVSIKVRSFGLLCFVSIRLIVLNSKRG